MDIRTIDREENRRRMANGELYYAFSPDLIADRQRCRKAYQRLNAAGDVSRRELVELWKEYHHPPPRLGRNVYVNVNSTWIDTCLISIGSRTLIGPNCSFFSGTHPLDPTLRNGTQGPESGKPITIGDDCWFGGNCIVLPGVTIGRGVTVGAGSVVTKDVPDHVVVAGNPARVIKKVEVSVPAETIPATSTNINYAS
ncbi:maltose O-acetyltransferase [Verticillium dahliae VdLs.17]|uniref:Maltose O-acetyltransferase n=1 Tax=Verticillium dahliae (strain VdLs.17 / ATCC MYA-4575 / FGSC 10137) TaxID=498257 RepID=G2X7I4_VERDV|nr:maltose O-acetyltransferase [Verticillium dahliae VdLs.17]EGY14952.1 maltose O-acetyltransferase [Verticillium dahliae VdLs.17]